MKTAAKVFLIIGMIMGFWGILPLVFGIPAVKRINNAKSHEELKTLGILSIIFVSLLGGIFMLCIKDSDLKN